MSKELTNSNGITIPEEFKGFEYVVFVAKTSSQKYDFILYTVRKQFNIDVYISNKLWHVVGFSNTVEDMINLSNLLDFTEGLKNVYTYHKGLLTDSFKHGLYRIKDCMINALKVKDSVNYCCEKIITKKDKFNNPWGMEIGINININMEKEEDKNKFIHLEGVEQVFPCHNISNNYFNPYEYKESDLKEMYLSYALKKDQYTTKHCPFFNINRYSCTFIDEIIIKK